MRAPIAPSLLASSLCVAGAFALLTSSPARAEIDCAQCRAVCPAKGDTHYPDDLQPEGPSKTVRHKSPENAMVFSIATKLDPAFGGKDLQGAIDEYRKAVVLDGENAQYRNYFAGALMASGNVDEAIYNLQAATRLVPSEAKYLVNLGYAFHRKGDETRALVHYMRALMLDGRDTRARLFTGYALEILGMRDDAILEFKKVLNQDRKNEGAARALARLGVASGAGPSEPPAYLPPN
jgi:tetratricopeptide (TPR) repeat protein